MSFNYIGQIESSKSMVNRGLILKALLPNLKLKYISHADDVRYLEGCLNDFSKSENEKLFDVGSGGTTFRFLALFLSRHPGVWKLKISNQLANRPQDGLLNILNQLGIQGEVIKEKNENNFVLNTKGWLKNFCTVDLSKSSQFLSGLLLSSVNLMEPFHINCRNRNLSSGYEIITLDLLDKIGIEHQDLGDEIIINPIKNNHKNFEISIGADWSSVISLLCFCFSGSSIDITNIDLKSKEPDVKGLDFLKEIGLEYNIINDLNFSRIQAKPSQLQKPKKIISLEKNPDLFPMLSIVASQIVLKTKSEVSIRYPEQLIYKESDRLGAIIKILNSLGYTISHDKNEKLIKINFSSKCDDFKFNVVFDFNSESDHRLVMCFELLKSFGYKINYNDPECVKKSFHNFFEIING